MMTFIIEGRNLEYRERLELEKAGRDILASGELKKLSTQKSCALALFENRIGSRIMAYVPKAETGDYLLEKSFCSECRKRPLLPCVHTYATALAAKNKNIVL